MRIAGVNIPEEKRLEIALTAVYGIGRSRAREILLDVKIDPGKKPKDLGNTEQVELRKKIDEFAIEGDLKRAVSGNIKRLKDIKAFRGVRHAKRLPARGQRTKTNSRTVRGNIRKTMGSGRKKVDKK